MSLVNLVTGATGTVGRPLVERLLAAGAEVRATSREPSSARLPNAVEVVRAEAESVPLEGVSAVFVNATALGLFNGAAGDPLATLLRRARASGVRRIVLLSSSSVLDDGNSVGKHHLEIEQQVERSGLEWSTLRPGVFSSNVLAWSAGIRAEKVVRAPFGEAHIAPIDERDIAAVAARALLSNGLLGAHLLSGPEVLTPVDQTRLIGEAIGVPLRYEEVPPAALRQAVIEAGDPPWAADGLLRYYAQATSRPVEISPAVQEITGEPPRTFASWVADHVDAFTA